MQLLLVLLLVDSLSAFNLHTVLKFTYNCTVIGQALCTVPVSLVSGRFRHLRYAWWNRQ
jgi:hypothetical protein